MNVHSASPNSIFEILESNVRSYCRDFSDVFDEARGAVMISRSGKRYLDCLAGAGTLNYGHNNPVLIDPVVSYLKSGRVVHSLDLHTVAKENFLETFNDVILKPRGLNYKMQFPGPTGTNAVETALKLARKVTGRSNVVAFSNGFHGMTQGSLAATANQSKREGAGMDLPGVTHLPFDGFLGAEISSIDVIKGMLDNPSSGVKPPAAFIVETVQGEGGLNVASDQWLQDLAALARKISALLIVDDIQAGIGRTGTFFSFEQSGITPDVVLLSKSLSGIGTPFSLVLLAPELDVWAPGEHNGTFRGNNLAFVAAEAAIRAFWQDDQFQRHISRLSEIFAAELQQQINKLPDGSACLKGRGMFIGIEFSDESVAGKLSRSMYQNGVIVETCGHKGQVLKLLPPLTMTEAEAREVLAALSEAIMDVLGSAPKAVFDCD